MLGSAALLVPLIAACTVAPSVDTSTDTPASTISTTVPTCESVLSLAEAAPVSGPVPSGAGEPDGDAREFSCIYLGRDASVTFKVGRATSEESSRRNYDLTPPATGTPWELPTANEAKQQVETDGKAVDLAARRGTVSIWLHANVSGFGGSDGKTIDVEQVKKLAVLVLSRG